jgi:3-methyladenine DNA glycosylase AlkD
MKSNGAVSTKSREDPSLRRRCAASAYRSSYSLGATVSPKYPAHAMPSSTLPDLRRELTALVNPARAKVLQRFFKTGTGQYGEGDQFLGLRVPQLRRLARAYLTLRRGSLLELLRSRWHEERLLALLILIEQYRRASDAERESIYRMYMSNTRHINNWDLVDTSAEHIVGAHLDPQRLQVLERLARSDSIWERRIAIMATFCWIKQDVFGPTLHVARLLLQDPEDLIHKAVGWMLREVGKRDRPREEEFLLEHYRAMPRTMLRYALEHFSKARRQQYLRGEV